MNVSVTCFNCGHLLSLPGLVGRREECPKCHADVHVCKNCQHYDPKVYNECRESAAEVVREKDRANFCDFFTPNSGASSAQDKKKDLLAAAEALFKKKS